MKTYRKTNKVARFVEFHVGYDFVLSCNVPLYVDDLGDYYVMHPDGFHVRLMRDHDHISHYAL